jgi:hypothetical protein
MDRLCKRWYVLPLFSILLTAFPLAIFAQGETYSYAYIAIEGKLFSKKLNVSVDLGDTPEQIKAGAEYSEKLSNKKSFAAVLNFMVDNQFELVETLDYTSNYQGQASFPHTFVF